MENKGFIQIDKLKIVSPIKAEVSVKLSDKELPFFGGSKKERLINIIKMGFIRLVSIFRNVDIVEHI